MVKIKLPDWFYVAYMWVCVAAWFVIPSLILLVGVTP